MIEGFKLDFTSDELRAHLTGREQHHSAKAVLYASQVAALQEDGTHANPGMTNDPVSGLQRSQREHADKAAYFALLAKHVIPNETYRLAEHDLGKLELLVRVW